MSGFKLNGGEKDISTIVVVLGLCLTFYIEYSKPQTTLTGSVAWVFYGLVLIYFVTQFFKNRLFRFYYAIKLWVKKQRQSTIIIDRRFFRLGISDDTGQVVNIYEETYFTRIKKKSSYSSEISVQGQIDQESIRTVNCSYTTNDLGNVRIYFLSDSLVTQGLAQNKAAFYSYSMNAINSFSNDLESWEFPIINFMKKLEVQLVFPKSRIPKKANVFKSKEKYEIDEMDEIENIDYQRYCEVPFASSPYCYKAIVKIFNLEIGRFYKIEWHW